MTRRHVDAERQRQSSVLVILLASFTIIRHFFSEALRKTNTQTHSARSDQQSDTWRGHLQHTLLIIKSYKKNFKKATICRVVPLIRRCFFAASLWDQKGCAILSSSHQIGFAWKKKERKKETSAPGGSFSGGTERLLSMKITWSGFKWIQIDNNERSCRMETHKCHSTEEFLFEAGCPLQLGSIIQHSSFFFFYLKPKINHLKLSRDLQFHPGPIHERQELPAFFFFFPMIKDERRSDRIAFKTRDD